VKTSNLTSTRIISKVRRFRGDIAVTSGIQFRSVTDLNNFPCAMKTVKSKEKIAALSIKTIEV
jgi:hypothetical protein